MFNVMKLLISKHFYSTHDEAQNKIDVFYATNRLTDEQYVELTELVIVNYGVPLLPNEPPVEILPEDQPIDPMLEAPVEVAVDEFV